jgi:PiT family inorganic phosphate transporter
MMLGASLASCFFIFSSSLFGMPISGTHTVVGSLIGAGIVGAGGENINWSKLSTIVLSWFVSPLLTALISYCLFMLICFTTLGGKGATHHEFKR